MPQNDLAGIHAALSATFKDHFSGHAREYAAERPGYPPALFEFLAAAAPSRRSAWDCATGNGQAALALARYFARVVATDASAEQLAAAARHPRVDYRCEPAERTALKPASCDLVTVAQAIHWFDVERFYSEVRRVARPGALLAVWTYDVLRVTAEVDRRVDVLNDDVVGGYWPPERRQVDDRYASLPFPFVELETDDFEMALDWSVERALSYLATWSSVRRYIADRGVDPVAAAAPALRAAWGAGVRRVRWPLTVRVGRV